MYHILLVDHHPSVVEGTKLMLGKEHDLQVNTATSPSEALRKIRTLPVDLVLIDLNMPQKTGVELTKEISDISPDVVIVIYTGFEMGPLFNRLIGTNISGFVPKTATQQQLITAVRCALRGEAVIPVELLRELRRVGCGGDHNDLAGWTPHPVSEQEMFILREIASGKSNKDIAQQLLMSQRSLEYQLTRLFQKLHVRSRVEAVAKANEYGLFAQK